MVQLTRGRASLRDSLMDFMYLVFAVVFFIVSWGLVRLCAMLKGDDQ